jgi:hypothetical protein
VRRAKPKASTNQDRINNNNNNTSVDDDKTSQSNQSDNNQKRRIVRRNKPNNSDVNNTSDSDNESTTLLDTKKNTSSRTSKSTPSVVLNSVSPEDLDEQILELNDIRDFIKVSFGDFTDSKIDKFSPEWEYDPDQHSEYLYSTKTYVLII